MNNSRGISDCESYCDKRPNIKNCKTDCLACQSATHNYILYDCHASGHKNCKKLKLEIEFLHGCPIPTDDSIQEGFAYMEEKREIQILATASIILSFILYVLKNKHLR